MNIENAKPEDASWLDEAIREQFPYTSFTPQHIIERINDPKYLVLVAKQVNIFTGFAELEFFLEKKEARLNAIYVEEAWRDQGIAIMLIEKVINTCKHKRIQRLFLLVKKNNEAAKGLYKKTGFTFEGMHDKVIDGSEVEVWAKSV